MMAIGCSEHVGTVKRAGVSRLWPSLQLARSRLLGGPFSSIFPDTSVESLQSSDYPRQTQVLQIVVWHYIGTADFLKSSLSEEALNLSVPNWKPRTDYPPQDIREDRSNMQYRKSSHSLFTTQL
jgi:hypothetical protein